MTHLDLAELRRLNLLRLPLFRNAHGELAHVSIDGRPPGYDWTPGQWGNALAGEVGELCNLLKKIDRGDVDVLEVRDEIGRECADVLTYLDLVAHRCSVDLGGWTVVKWNEVAIRVGVPLRLAPIPLRERAATLPALPDPAPEADDPVLLEVHDLPRHLFAVYDGVEGEDPALVALFLSATDADDYLTGKGTDGEHLVFGARTPAWTMTPVRYVVANDYRVGTFAELDAALRGKTRSGYDGDAVRTPGALLRSGDPIRAYLASAPGDARVAAYEALCADDRALVDAFLEPSPSDEESGV